MALGRYFPLYSANVLFEVQAGISSASEVSSGGFLDEKFVNQVAQTQIVLLRTEGVITQAVKDNAKVKQTEWFKSNFIDDENNPKIYEAIDDLLENVRASVVRETQLFSLGWSRAQPG